MGKKPVFKIISACSARNWKATLSVSRTLSETFETVCFVELLSTPPSANDNEELDAIVNSRRLYDSCLDEDRIETEGIKSILTLINTEFGGWPILQGSEWNSSAFNFTRLLLKLNEYNNFAVFVVATHTNERNSSINGIRVCLEIALFCQRRNEDRLAESRITWLRRSKLLYNW